MGRTRQKQSKDRHQEILEAAARVITDRGLAETRISDIAERCGVSPGLILYYFESKDRLLVEALTYANDKYLPRAGPGSAAPRDRARAVRATGRPLGAGPVARLRAPGGMGPVDRDLGPRPPRPGTCERGRGAGPSLATVDRRHHPERTRDAGVPGGRRRRRPGTPTRRIDRRDGGTGLDERGPASPEAMKRMCMEVASKLIGFSLERASA